MDCIKKNKGNKIQPFPTLEEREMDQETDNLIKEQLLKDSDDYERELNEDPDLDDVKAPDGLFDKIVNQLKEEGIWEEEMEKEEIAKEPCIDPYELLSEADREALRIGRKAQKRKKWSATCKWAGRIAVVLVCVFVVGMSSEANRTYMVGLINSFTGRSFGVEIENNEDRVKYAKEEQEAYTEVKNVLGIGLPELQYKPEGMEYYDYKVSKERGTGFVSYMYRKSIMTLYICHKDKKASHRQLFDGNIIEKVKMNSYEKEVEIWESECSDGTYLYGAGFDYNNIYYAFWGKCDKKDFENIVKTLIL